MADLKEHIDKLKAAADEVNADWICIKLIDRPDGSTVVIGWARSEEDVPEMIERDSDDAGAD